MNFDERKLKILQFVKTYGEITNSDAQALNSVHRNTATSDLKKLVEEKVLIAYGSNKGSSYRLLETLIFSPKDLESVFSKKEHSALEKYFKTHDRKKVFFNKVGAKALNLDLSFPEQINKSFESMKEKIDEKRKSLSNELRKKKKEKLVIDLSWASSNIEGNTYSLLETENLLTYNQTAKGKDFLDAQMILNHKEAIEYIRSTLDYNKLTKQGVLELHQILVKNLGVDTGFREHLVSISNSSFVPCDNKFQIISYFESILEKINKTKSILEKAIACNLLFAFLQPFADGNKRTSRMLGNAILMSHGLIPISFAHTPKEDYIKGILYFYEEQSPDFFKQLFLSELNSSFREYIG